MAAPHCSRAIWRPIGVNTSDTTQAVSIDLPQPMRDPDPQRQGSSSDPCNRQTPESSSDGATFRHSVGSS